MTAYCVTVDSCRSDGQIRYEQYVIAGKSLYENHCANCHGKNGEGLRNLYPSLNTSVRLNDTPYITCLIRNGSTGKDINMPGNKELYALDIAQIITYLTDRWGEKKMTHTEEVAQVEC